MEKTRTNFLYYSWHLARILFKQQRFIHRFFSCNYVTKDCLRIVCHALRIFNFLREGRQIGVHDGYIHRFSGLKFLWITWLELHSVECNCVLCDKLTLSQMCSLTTNAFPAAFLCTGSEWGNHSRTVQNIVVRWKQGSTTARSIVVLRKWGWKPQQNLKFF